MSEGMVWMMIGFSGVALLCLWGNLRQLRRHRMVSDTPTSKVLGVFIGTAELKGTAESGEPLASYLTHQPCVWYSWNVDESWSRTVTESYTDSKGNQQTRTRRESGWKTVASGGEAPSFYLKDQTGLILVRPSGASIEPRALLDETVGRSHPLYYSKGPSSSIAHSDQRRRFVETAIPLHSPLYVIGSARERTDLVAPEIAAQEDTELFLISTREEEKIKSAYTMWAWIFGVTGFALASVPLIVAVAQAQHHGYFNPWLIAPPAAYIAAWALGWVWMVYNSLVGLRQRVRQGWSLIEVQLKRRQDLIPRLSTVVSALGNHEQSVQTALARLRAQFEVTSTDASAANVGGLVGTVRAIAENYPEITAHANFIELQKQLVETEQRIALARTYYNDIATEFATRLTIVPDRWVSALHGMKPEPLLQAEGFERAAVKVDLK